MQRYKDRNFLLVSTNSDPIHSTVTTFFAKKDDLTHNATYFTNEVFNKFKEEKIIPILERIDEGVYNIDENAEFDTELRDILKNSLYVSIPASIAIIGGRFILAHNPEILKFIKSGEMTKTISDFCKKHNITKEHFMVFAREFISSKDKGFFNKFKDAGKKTFTFYYSQQDAKSDNEQNEEIKSGNKKDSNKQKNVPLKSSSEDILDKSLYMEKAPI